MRPSFLSLVPWAALSLTALLATTAQAQSSAAGKIVYTTPQVVGQLSCSAGACHTLSPSNNQNRILADGATAKCEH